MPSRDWKRGARGMPWFPGETLITGIGQGALLATPLQLSSATGALAMKGERFKPHLVKAIEFPVDGLKMETEPEISGTYQFKKEQNWEHVVKAMINVVHNVRGTAHYRAGRGLKYEMAGKTGTAQVFGIAQDAEYEEEEVAERLRDHALFVAFAPAHDPRIAVAVIVENGGHGSSVAAPIARKLMDAYLLREPSVKTATGTEVVDG
jgi:penicillin-binding protein 2